MGTAPCLTEAGMATPRNSAHVLRYRDGHASRGEDAPRDRTSEQGGLGRRRVATPDVPT
jgi:hypothetical protein